MPIRIRYAIFVILSAAAAHSGRAQTDPDGNYEVFSRETAMAGVGYVTSRLTLPTAAGDRTVTARGAWFVRHYGLSEVGTIVAGTNHEFRFALEGGMRVGATFGKAEFTDGIPALYNSPDEQLYTVFADLFTVDFTPQYSYVFDEGNAITLRAGLTIVNVGAAAVIPGSGEVLKNTIAYAPFLPLAYRIALLFDLGRSGVGIEFYGNPYTIIGYRYVPPSLGSLEKGVVFWDSSLARYSVNLAFIF
jgi:hypothetical protein